MQEGKTVLKRMAFYYLLLAVNILPCANVIADRFPTRNVSTLYLLILSICLVLYYAHRVPPAGALSRMMKALSWMGLFMILLRGVKYSAFSEVGVLARHTWYLYYVPMLLLPLFLFYISILVSPNGSEGIPGRWYWTLVVTGMLIGLVLTNDLHRQVFAFQPDYVNWDADYTHGWLFYVVTFWQYALYLAALVILVVQCRIASAKRTAWLLLIPFAIGIVLNILLLTGRMPKLNGTNIVEFPEVLIFTAAIVLEGCMQLGLIPTNTDYGRLFRLFSISALITDGNGSPVYASDSAIPPTQEQLALPDGSRIDEHTVLRKMQLPGGFGFWRDDMRSLDRLNEELEDAREALAQEAELTRLRGELKQRQAIIEQRTLVYDTIARHTQRQSQRISELAKAARLSKDPAQKETCRRRITLLGAYIKRYANLMLLSQESRTVEAGELGLSFSEVLRYLNSCGVPGELVQSADCAVPAEAALAVFEAFETLVENNLSSLQGVFVNLSSPENVTVKLTLENLVAPLSAEEAARLSAAGIAGESQGEDDVTYICLTLPKGGEAA